VLAHSFVQNAVQIRQEDDRNLFTVCTIFATPPNPLDATRIQAPFFIAVRGRPASAFGLAGGHPGSRKEAGKVSADWTANCRPRVSPTRSADLEGRLERAVAVSQEHIHAGRGGDYEIRLSVAIEIAGHRKDSRDVLNRYSTVSVWDAGGARARTPSSAPIRRTTGDPDRSISAWLDPGTQVETRRSAEFSLRSVQSSALPSVGF